MRLKHKKSTPSEIFNPDDFRDLQNKILTRDHHLWESGLVIERLLEMAPERVAVKLNSALKVSRNKLNNSALLKCRKAKIQYALTEWCNFKTCLKLDREHAASLAIATLEELVSKNADTSFLAEQGCEHASAKLLELETRAGMKWPDIHAHLAISRSRHHQVVLQLNWLIEKNMGLANDVASETRAYGEPFEDKRQNGFIGLRKAILNFNPDYGFKFSSFAWPIIRSTIIRAAQCESRTIELPSHVHEKLKKIREFEESYYSEHLGRHPSLEEIAVETGLELSVVLDLLLHRLPILALDSPFDGEHGLSLLEAISDGHQMAFDEDLHPETVLQGEFDASVPEKQRIRHRAA
jgi:DNA-directed RNA polymerase sigma subunit (sigma70/sigma32)